MLPTVGQESRHTKALPNLPTLLGSPHLSSALVSLPSVPNNRCWLSTSGEQQEDRMLDVALGSEKKSHVRWLCGLQQAV